MNMQQRRYIVKKRIEPMQSTIKICIRNHNYIFKKYKSWGDLIRMVKSGELQLARKYYHKSCQAGTIYAKHDNPFGEDAGALLGGNAGVQVDEVQVKQDSHDWDKQFEHATDFIMLACEETGIKLLHDLERMVDKYKAEADGAYDKANKEQKVYMEWLESEHEEHNYKEGRSATNW